MDLFFDHFSLNFHEFRLFHPFSAILLLFGLVGSEGGSHGRDSDVSNMPKTGKTGFIHRAKRWSQKLSRNVKKWSHRGLQREWRHGGTEKSVKKSSHFAVLVKKCCFATFHVFGCWDISDIMVLEREPFLRKVAVLTRIMAILTLKWPLFSLKGPSNPHVSKSRRLKWRKYTKIQEIIDLRMPESTLSARVSSQSRVYYQISGKYQHFCKIPRFR